MLKLSALLTLCLAASALATPDPVEFSNEIESSAGDALTFEGIRFADDRELKMTGKAGTGKGMTKIKGTRGPKATKAPKGGKTVKGTSGRASPVVKQLIKSLENGEDIDRSGEILVNKFLMMGERMQIRSAEIAAGTFDVQAWRMSQRKKARDAARGGRVLEEAEEESSIEDVTEARDLKGTGKSGTSTGAIGTFGKSGKSGKAGTVFTGKGITKIKGTRGPKATKAPKGGKTVKGTSGRASPVVKQLIKSLENGEDIDRSGEILVNKFLMMGERMQIRSAEIAAGTFDVQAWRVSQRKKARDAARGGRELEEAETEEDIAQ